MHAEVYVDRTEAAFLFGDQWLGFSGGDAQEGCAKALEALAQEAKAKRARKVRLWLSGRLARPFLLPEVAGLRNHAEALRYAAALAQQRHPEEAPCAIWLDSWRAGEACLGVAMSRTLREALYGLFDQEGVRIDGLAPWWAAASNALALPDPQDCVHVCQEAEVSTVIGLRASRVEFVETLEHSTRHGEPDRALIQRALVGGGLLGASIRQVTLGRVGSDMPLDSNYQGTIFPATVEAWL